MKPVVSGALLGAALSVVFKVAQARRVLPLPAVIRKRPAGARPSPSTPAELETLTKEELYERARVEKIPGRSGMTKEQLIEALRKRRGGG